MSRKRKQPDQPAQKRRNWWRALPFFLLIAVGFVAYWNSFDVPLVFDDLNSIQRNAGVLFGDALQPSRLISRSLLFATFAMNYAIGGQNVWGYHLVNLVLHILNGIIIFFIAQQVFRKANLAENKIVSWSLLAALFFVAHPVQTESVTYISSRSELLSTLFYVIAFLIFVRWPEVKIGFGLSILITVLFMLGLGTKETVISLPATLLLYDFIFISGGRVLAPFKRWRFYLIFVTTGLFAIYFLLTGSLKFLLTSPYHLAPKYYFLTETRVVVKYIQLVFLPVGLNLNYDFSTSLGFLQPPVLFSIAVILCFLVLAWLIREREPVLSFSIFWFFLTLAPTSSFIPILDVIFEHRLYLPLVGVCLAFPVLMEHLVRWTKVQRWLNWSVVRYASIIIGVLLIATILRNEVWRSDERLWLDVISKSPHAARPYNALAFVYVNRGETEKAIAISREGMRNVPSARHDFDETIGNLYLKLNRVQEAIDMFKDNIEESKRLGLSDDGQSVSYNNLGVTYLYLWRTLQDRRSQFSEQEFNRQRDDVLSHAEDAFAESLKRDPGNEWSLDSYVNVAFDWGKADALIADQLKNGEATNFRALYTIGKIRFLQKNYKEAAEYFEKAEALDKTRNLLYYNHGYALDQMGDIDGAIAKYTMAIRIDPIFSEAHHNVALLYVKKGDFANAIANLNEVLRRDPNNVLSNLELAKIYVKQGNRTSARDAIQLILRVSPQNPDALALLQYVNSTGM